MHYLDSGRLGHLTFDSYPLTLIAPTEPDRWFRFAVCCLQPALSLGARALRASSVVAVECDSSAHGGGNHFPPITLASTTLRCDNQAALQLGWSGDALSIPHLSFHINFPLVGYLEWETHTHQDLYVVGRVRSTRTSRINQAHAPHVRVLQKRRKNPPPLSQTKVEETKRQDVFNSWFKL
jgi:hypothetical protein